MPGDPRPRSRAGPRRQTTLGRTGRSLRPRRRVKRMPTGESAKWDLRSWIRWNRWAASLTSTVADRIATKRRDRLASVSIKRTTCGRFSQQKPPAASGMSIARQSSRRPAAPGPRRTSIPKRRARDGNADDRSMLRATGGGRSGPRCRPGPSQRRQSGGPDLGRRYYPSCEPKPVGDSGTTGGWKRSRVVSPVACKIVNPTSASSEVLSNQRCSGWRTQCVR